MIFALLPQPTVTTRLLAPAATSPNDLPQFRWINTLLGNLKTSFSGTFHAFNFGKYARRYRPGHCFRINRRFSTSGMTKRITKGACCCIPLTEGD